MKKNTRGSLLITLTGVILTLISCAPGSCFEETESYVKVSFYHNTTLAAPDSLTLYGLNSDSIIYDNKSGVQPALIPLNSSSDSCTFIVIINGITDTLEFHYSSYPHLISKECGYTFYHHLDSAPKPKYHSIKDIYVSNPTITNLNAENLRIFY